jgi:hypothetical protein
MNRSVPHMLLRLLGDGETLLAYGMAVEPALPEFLRQARPGFQVRKIPSSFRLRTSKRVGLPDSGPGLLPPTRV